MTSLLATIRAAVRPGTAIQSLDSVEGHAEENADTALDAGQADPHNLNPTPGGDMSETQTVAGAVETATATIAAVAAAASGGSDGFNMAMERMNAILGADGIKGDAKRMTAALELANASPDMSADAVVAFVTANVPATVAQDSQQAAQPSPAAAYEQRRMAAANLAMPGDGQQTKAESGLSKAVSARIEALKSAR